MVASLNTMRLLNTARMVDTQFNMQRLSMTMMSLLNSTEALTQKKMRDEEYVNAILENQAQWLEENEDVFLPSQEGLPPGAIIIENVETVYKTPSTIGEGNCGNCPIAGSSLCSAGGCSGSNKPAVIHDDGTNYYVVLDAQGKAIHEDELNTLNPSSYENDYNIISVPKNNLNGEKTDVAWDDPALNGITYDEEITTEIVDGDEYDEDGIYYVNGMPVSNMPIFESAEDVYDYYDEQLLDEGEYRSELEKINKKDRMLQMQQQNLQTQLTGLQTANESVSQQLKKDIETSFKLLA